MKTVLAVIGGVVTVLFLIGMLATIGTTYKYEPAQTAVDNTARNIAKNEFVTGCTEEGAEKGKCACAFEALTKHLGPKWYENMTLVDRILSEGYNYEETRAVMVACNISEI